MSKGNSSVNQFSRFKPSQLANLLIIQAYTFGVANARQKLKEHKFRQADLLSIMIVGELGSAGCLVSDFKTITGSTNKTSANKLNRSSWSGVTYKVGLGRGRGNTNRYYLTLFGQQIFDVVKEETSKLILNAQELLMNGYTDYNSEKGPIVRRLK